MTAVEIQGEALFIDTNVLIYANVVAAPPHDAALSALNSAGEAGRTLWISRQAVREYLVTRTRTQALAAVLKATLLEQVRQFVERFGGGGATPRLNPGKVLPASQPAFDK